MNRKQIIISTVTACLLTGSAMMYMNLDNKEASNPGDSILNNTPNGYGDPYSENEKENDAEKISVYDFVNETLKADGFTYLGGTKWGRGEKNYFVIDLAKQEFQIADYNALNVLPDEWYKNEFDKYVSFIYKHETKRFYLMDLLKVNPNLDERFSTVNSDEMASPDNIWHELPIWMDYYINRFKNYGCDVTGDLSEAKLDWYKTQESKATINRVASVFDEKSTDGVLRYYNDVHVSGKVEDNPRYMEIQSIEEFIELKKQSGFELTYMINILNSKNDKVFDSDGSNLQASIIKEFVKDVVYQNTPARDDVNKIETIGVYFINVDNQNGNFRSMYTAPTKGVGFDYPLSIFGKDLRNFRMPFEGTVIGAEKDPETGYSFVPFNIFNIQQSLKEYLWYITYLNPNVKFSDDFIRNYSRPFAYDWQERMGLKALFTEKYGMLSEVKYIN